MKRPEIRCSDRLYHHTPTYIPIPSLTASALKRIVNITTASRRVSLISSSPPIKYVTPSSGKGREMMVPCRPASACVHSPPTSRCARRRRVGDERGFTAHANTTPLYSFKTNEGGKPSVICFSSERWSLARSPARSLAANPASGTEYFQGFFGFWNTCFASFLF